MSRAEESSELVLENLDVGSVNQLLASPAVLDDLLSLWNDPRAESCDRRHLRASEGMITNAARL
jgi:hypothetical protein